MYIRYNTQNNKVISISNTKLNKNKNTDVIKITKTEYNKIKDKNIKQLYVVNQKINFINDNIFHNIQEKEKETQIKQENRKIIEQHILLKYPYYKQINNIYMFLKLVENPLKNILNYENMDNEQKKEFDKTYNMINDIFNDLNKYKIAQSEKKLLNFNNTN